MSGRWTTRVGQGLARLGVSRASRPYRYAQRIAAGLVTKPYRRSYANYGEDLVLAAFLPEVKGHYVDVGAGRALRGSNTYLLYRRGWRGVLVDPLSANCAEARRRRPGDVVLQRIISDVLDTQTIWEFQPSEISTTSQHHALDLERRGFTLVGRNRVDSVTLASLGLRATPEDPTLLSIDVETQELEVLRGIDWTAYLPRVVCIEDSQQDSNFQATTDVFRQLTYLGYVLQALVGASSIYVHRTYLLRIRS